METLQIVKIGGNIIDSPEKLKEFLMNFSRLKGLKILIHGGGKVATDLSKDLGIEAKMIEGRRITNAETLKVITMVYAGLINKNIVAQLQAIQCNAIGLTGADADLIPAKMRNPEPVDFGFAGDVLNELISKKILNLFLNNGLVPVFAPLTHDQKGSLLNTNADTIASSLAKALAKDYNVKLIYCFEKRGVLLDSEKEDSIIQKISIKDYPALKKKGIVSRGMIPKLDNAFSALVEGVDHVLVCHADALKENVTIEMQGTELTL